MSMGGRVAGLLAIGEVAMTGLHGACRLASNSLLEGLVMGQRAADVVRAATVEFAAGDAVDFWRCPRSQRSRGRHAELGRGAAPDVELRRHRPHRSSARARRRRIELIREEIREYYWDFKVTADLLELRNLALCAHLIIDCAQRRRESRGLHYNADHPERSPEFLGDTVVQRDSGPNAR